ncbi:hypothetical protein, partial [Phascolarctobacterium faecium]|uniref:hypothetical protein n=1 Tax=Phascolarctobacterium faecium TaxID=33025 RepID=UPI003AAC738D
ASVTSATQKRLKKCKKTCIIRVEKAKMNSDKPMAAHIGVFCLSAVFCTDSCIRILTLFYAGR